MPNDDFGTPITLVIDGEQIAGYRLQRLDHGRAIVTDDPMAGDRFFARQYGLSSLYIVESEGPNDLQTF